MASKLTIVFGIVSVIAICGVVALAMRIQNMQQTIVELQSENSGTVEKTAPSDGSDPEADTIVVEGGQAIRDLNDKLNKIYPELDSIHNELTELRSAINNGTVARGNGADGPNVGDGELADVLRSVEDSLGSGELGGLRDAVRQVLEEDRTRERAERTERRQMEITSSIGDQVGATEYQKAQIQDAMKTRFDAMSAMREDETLDDTQRQEASFQAADQFDMTMKSTLNAEQYMKYESWKAERDWWIDRNRKPSDDGNRRRNRRNRDGG